MGTSIGNLAVTLSLDAAAFMGGLDKGDAKLKQFGASIGKTLAIVSAAQEGLGVIGAPFAWIKQGIDEVADLGREALKLNVSTEKLSALQELAGRDAGVWESALRHLNVELGAAAMGSEEAKNKFKAMGLDGAAIARMGLDKGLDVLADKFKEVGDGAAGARHAEQLFGKEAAMVVPYLKEGAAGMAAAAEAAKKHGTLVTSDDAKKAFLAQRAMDDLGRTWTGFQRTIAIEFAPVVADVAKSIGDMMDKAGGGRAFFKQIADTAKGFLANVLSVVEEIAATIADVVQQAKGLGKGIGSAGKAAVGAPILGAAGKGIGAAWNWVQGKGVQGDSAGAAKPPDSAGQSVRNMMDPWIKDLKNDGDQSSWLRDMAKSMGMGGLLDQFDKLGKEMDEARQKAEALKDLQTKAENLTESLHEQAAAFGMGAEAVQRMKLAHDGLSDEQLKDVDAGIREINALKELSEAAGRGTNIFEQQDDKIAGLNDALKLGTISLKGFTAAYKKMGEEFGKKVDAEALRVIKESEGPMDRFKADMESLNQLQAMGKITGGEYAAQLAKDLGDLGALSEAVRHPDAAMQGSREAYETIMRSQDTQRPDDLNARVVKAIERLEKQQAAAERTNQQIADAITRIFVKGK